ncbi:MAG: putative methyltransferase [Candidatus Saccharibacteria bacterium]|nr:putative methyltransferase [Candidatus Saccharibacteria bacterium]
MTNTIGVGPHPQPWPVGEQYDAELLENGDRRNVVDKYRYWTVEAIKKDLDNTRSALVIAIENWQHDFNIGTIVRTANAFNANAVHIIGRRHWNKRGAMVTDLYMNMYYHDSVDSFTAAMQQQDRLIVGIDIIPGAKPLHATILPKNVALVFGGEGPGLSDNMKAACSDIIMIEQSGSTRSVNVGVAAGIVMYAWTKVHIDQVR